MIEFSKFHGLGNDFIVVDEESLAGIHKTQWADLAKRLCKRSHGVGADGLLIHSPSRSTSDSTAKMTVVNADGSIPEMCGNGLRCFVHALVRKGVLHEPNNPIETAAGVLETRWEERDGEFLVTVDMGTPRSIGSPQILEALGEEWAVHPVSMGNPHGVIFLSEPQNKARYRELAVAMAGLPSFPEGVNAGFAVPTPSGLELVVHERGCGFTEACGTGACAAVVAAIHNGIGQTGQDMLVRLPGGSLRINWPHPDAGVWMTGPSVHVYEGILHLA